MVEIGQTIISNDIFEKCFECDIHKCKGACCVEGDSGAPLTSKEAEIIKKEFHHFSDFLPESHKKEIKKQGFAIIDSDGDLVTPLVNNRQCVYSFYDEDKILKCAIEKAFINGKLKFKKPISCHLFPIRITEYKQFDAINYQEIKICKSAKKNGSEKKIKLYKFLKEPLIRKYGKLWYKELEIAAQYIEKNSKK